MVDETVEVLLDTGAAVTEVLAGSVPFKELHALMRELTVEILEVYRIVADDLGLDFEGVER